MRAHAYSWYLNMISDCMWYHCKYVPQSQSWSEKNFPEENCSYSSWTHEYLGVYSAFLEWNGDLEFKLLSVIFANCSVNFSKRAIKTMLNGYFFPLYYTLYFLFECIMKCYIIL